MPSPSVSIPALEVRQWLRGWDSMEFKVAQRRRRPPESFYVLSLDAAILRRLAGIHRRETDSLQPRAADTGIQRAHDSKRSSEISRFVTNGYPWSRLRETDRRSGTFDDLRKPGWLPTAIVVNILTSRDRRKDNSVAASDLVRVTEADHTGFARIELPASFDEDWSPARLHPIEVIDGQHRLWAFDAARSEEYQLPVVAFVGLDISWQAYLFWTINIMPTKINPSLAFDLYPLLRSEDWLERLEGPRVYREARAQELTEVLWSHSQSPWLRRINMLGQARGLGVTQAGFVRGLMNTFFRRSSSAAAPGGLYAAPLPGSKSPLAWSRAQQGAFLIYAWAQMQRAVDGSRADWALFLRPHNTKPEPDPAFAGRDTYLNTEQGVRAFLGIVNDLCFVSAQRIELASWSPAADDSLTDAKSVSAELDGLAEQRVAQFLEMLTDLLAGFDWRGVDADGLTDADRALKRAFRGSGGYVEFRRQVLRHLGRHASGELRREANELLRKIKSRSS